MRQKTRRIVLNIPDDGTLTVTDPLGLIDKEVTLTLGALTVREAMVRSARNARKAEAEIVIDCASAQVDEVVGG